MPALTIGESAHAPKTRKCLSLFGIVLEEHTCCILARLGFHLIFAVTLLQVGVSNMDHRSTDCIRHHPDRDFYNRLQSCFRLHQTQDDAQHSDAGAALPTRQLSINAHTSMRRTWVSLKSGTLPSSSAASPARCTPRAAAFRCISVSLSDSEPGVSGHACSLNSYNGVQLCHVCLFFIFSNWRYCTCACGSYPDTQGFNPAAQ